MKHIHAKKKKKNSLTIFSISIPITIPVLTTTTILQVCQHVVDIHEDTVVTENCQELVTTTCTQTSQVTKIDELKLILSATKPTTNKV